MGLFQSSLARQPCVIVEPMTGCPRGNVGINTSKPLGLSVDDALWSEFAQKIDPLARMLNRGLLVATTILFAVAIAFVITNMVVMTSIVSLFPVIIGVIVVIGITLAFVLHVQNPKVDKLIEEVIAEFRPRFGEKGHKIEYLTQFTGTCKPKGARSERVIVFPIMQETVVEAGNAQGDSTPTTQTKDEEDVPSASLFDKMKEENASS
uniref:Uncharacterized protein n=1 Tax=Trieres chinensis TaxID=1514140 RepID=A0A7S1ZH87_TRICV|mmetsp:Transcript_25268/g.51567  ORF Transcript_25268/g.51567 Transcript_25268/m.51567 type:complete len:207 (+) Transcript_25268:94-714(+)